MLALAPQILFGLGEEGGEPHLSHKLSASGCLGLPRVSPTTYKGAAKRRGGGVGIRHASTRLRPPARRPGGSAAVGRPTRAARGRGSGCCPSRSDRAPPASART